MHLKPNEIQLVYKSELLKMARNGRINANTQVKREDMEHFAKAGQPRSLFVASLRASSTKKVFA